MAGTGADIADDRKGFLGLLNTLNGFDAAAIALVLHQQAIETTASFRRMFFQATGAFAKFERGMVLRASAP